jgi:predicted phosphoribosyltransferase
MNKGGERARNDMFEDRLEAGQALASALDAYRNAPDAVVLALPRGGVVVGFAVSRALGLPLDVIITRKLRAPENPEYALGALTETGDRFVNPDVDGLVVDSWGKEYLEQETAWQRSEIERRKELYRNGAGLGDLAGQTVLLVDDGVATGSTLIAAVRGVRAQNPNRIVVGIPVGSRQAIESLSREADEVVAVSVPSRFFAVGEHYRYFPQVSDDEVVRYLREAARPPSTSRQGN